MHSRHDVEVVGAAALGERNEWQEAIIMSWGVQSGHHGRYWSTIVIGVRCQGLFPCGRVWALMDHI